MQAKQSIPLAMQMPFTYAVTVTLAVSAAATATLILDMDSEFDLYALSAVSDQDGALAAGTAPVFVPENFTLQIQIQSSGRNLSSEALRRGNQFGKLTTNLLPEGRPIRFPRKTQFTLQFLNLIAAQNVVQVAFKGYKIFSGIPGSG